MLERPTEIQMFMLIDEAQERMNQLSSTLSLKLRELQENSGRRLIMGEYLRMSSRCQDYKLIYKTYIDALKIATGIEPISIPDLKLG